MAGSRGPAAGLAREQHFAEAAWDRAIASFRLALTANSHDKLSEIYIERCQFMKSNPPRTWDGIWKLESK